MTTYLLVGATSQQAALFCGELGIPTHEIGETVMTSRGVGDIRGARGPIEVRFRLESEDRYFSDEFTAADIEAMNAAYAVNFLPARTLAPYVDTIISDGGTEHGGVLGNLIRGAVASAAQRLNQLYLEAAEAGVGIAFVHGTAQFVEADDGYAIRQGDRYCMHPDVPAGEVYEFRDQDSFDAWEASR